MPWRRAPSGGSKQGPSCLSQLLRTPGVQAPLGLGPRRPVPACGHTATPFVFLCLPLPSGASAQSWAPAGDIPTGWGLGGRPCQPRLLPRQAHMRTGRYGTRPAHAGSRWPPRGRSASRSRAERARPARRTPWNPGARAPAWADEKLAGLDGGGDCTRLRSARCQRAAHSERLRWQHFLNTKMGNQIACQPVGTSSWGHPSPPLKSSARAEHGGVGTEPWPAPEMSQQLSGSDLGRAARPDPPRSRPRAAAHAPGPGGSESSRDRGAAPRGSARDQVAFE